MKKFCVALLVVFILGSCSNAWTMDFAGKFGFTLKGGMGIPLRDFADDDKLGASIGFGFGTDATHFLSNRVGVGVCLDYNFFTLESPEDVDLSLKLFNFGAFVKYIVSTNSNMSPYLKLEVGLYEPTIVPKAGGDKVSKDFSMKFGFGVGGGVMFKVSDFILVGGEAMFHDAMVKDARIESEAGVIDQFGYTLQYVKVNVGITFLFGRR